MGQCPQPIPEVVVAAKAFNKWECKRYLDRNVLREGYLPVQLSIVNSTDGHYFFSPSNLSLPTAPPELVAQSVHTSTVARAVGYGAAAALICWPFAIPAIVDGINSAQANIALDADFYAKAARDCVIPAHSYANMLLFVPIGCYCPTFQMTLIDMCTDQPCGFAVTVTR